MAPYLEDARPMRVNGPIELLPDGRTLVIFRVLEGGRADLHVAGPRTHTLTKHVTGVDRGVVLQLRPGWSASLLGVPASTLTDRLVSLEDLWGRAGGELRDRLVATRSLPEAVEHVAQAIALRCAGQEPAAARLARRAVRLFERGEVRVDAVAERLGVTARHLRRAFLDSVGVGPKEFARTVRLQRALRLAETTGDWGRIAAAAGYYDQAHLIAEFRELVGVTPGAFRAGHGDGAGAVRVA